MSSVLSEIVLAVNDLPAQARFWSAVLELPAEFDDGVAEILLPTGVSFLLVPVPEPKTVQDRMHLDLSPRGCEQAEEVARVEALGARRVDVGQGPDVSWVVLADPEGNEFCILSGRHDPS